nr:hypothetical protein [uncultured Undibacterium sp.]
MLDTIVSRLVGEEREKYDYLLETNHVLLRDLSADWEHWEMMPRAKLYEVVQLSCDLEPTPNSSYRPDKRYRDKSPKHFIAHWFKEVDKRLAITIASLDLFDFKVETTFDAKDISHKTISTYRFRIWAEQVGFELPSRFPKDSTKISSNTNGHSAGIAMYPWGTHSTILLEKLAKAATKFWSLYDPSDPSTAPTNEQVQTWLMSEGVKERNAEVMATILRADGLATGRRK